MASWQVGSADVAGTITDTGAGCTDTRVTLKFYDHNDALVQSFRFGAGEMDAGQSKRWTTHMIGLLVDDPVGPTATRASATGECADQH